VRDDNAPLPGVWVTGRLLSGEPAEFVALTGRGGRVDVDVPATGTWEVRADAGAAGWAMVRASAGSGTTPVTLEIEPTSTVTGRVVDDRGRPVPGARVVPGGRGARIEVPHGFRIDVAPPPLPETRTGADGRFVLNLPEREGVAYVFDVHAPGHASESLVVPAARVEVAVALDRFGALRLPCECRVDPEAVEIVVSTYERRGRRVAGTVAARIEDGTLVADGVAPGRIELQVLRGGALPPGRFPLAPGATATQPAIVVGAGGSLEALVTDGAEPLPERWVYARGPNGAVVAQTDAKGRARFASLQPGGYTLLVAGQDPVSEKRNRRVIVTEGRTASATVVLDRP
jgi:hypothetical protein